MDGELSDLIDEMFPLVFRKPVGVNKQSQLIGAMSSIREPVEFSDVVVMELHVQPGDLGQLPGGNHGTSVVLVDERSRSTLASKDVPGAEVAVADDGLAAGQ